MVTKKLSNALAILGHPRCARKLLQFYRSGYLLDVGWFRAFEASASVGANREPIPWVTYPFIDFISDRLKPNMELFEFGSGNSTLYYASRVRSVTTVEHDPVWYQKVREGLPRNVSIRLCDPPADGYSRAAVASNQRYDIIVVDGIDRHECTGSVETAPRSAEVGPLTCWCRSCCVRNSLPALRDTGVVILDDSERERFADIYSFLEHHSFRHIDFWGISPGLFYRKCTTVFYRSPNCLDI